MVCAACRSPPAIPVSASGNSPQQRPPHRHTSHTLHTTWRHTAWTRASEDLGPGGRQRDAANYSPRKPLARPTCRSDKSPTTSADAMWDLLPQALTGSTKSWSMTPGGPRTNRRPPGIPDVLSRQAGAIRESRKAEQPWPRHRPRRSRCRGARGVMRLHPPAPIKAHVSRPMVHGSPRAGRRGDAARVQGSARLARKKAVWKQPQSIMDLQVHFFSSIVAVRIAGS